MMQKVCKDANDLSSTSDIKTPKYGASEAAAVVIASATTQVLVLQDYSVTSVNIYDQGMTHGNVCGPGTLALKAGKPSWLTLT